MHKELQPIFKYESAKRYVVDFVAYHQATDQTFSLRRWAKSMGLNSHAHLVLLLQGKRPLTLKWVPTLAQGMHFSSPERLYFQALIQFDSAKTEEEKDLCRLWLSEANPGREYRVREIDEYVVIAHWVHMAILAMTDNALSVKSADQIYRRLGGKVTVAEVRAAVERLLALNLVRMENGRYKCTCERVTTKDDVANRGAREYHRQVARLGIEAVERQSVEEREFQSFAVSVPHAKIPLAKEMIRKFRTQFYKAMTASPGDEVYQTQIQFFRLTESPSEMVPKEDEGTGIKARKGV